MNRIINTIIRYSQKNNSSLAFWWLPVYEGNDIFNFNLNQFHDYYLDFSAKAEYNVLFDDNNVIMLDYKGSIGKQYNPCAVAQYGLGLLSKYMKTNDNTYLEKAIIQGNWLCNTMVLSELNIGRLEYDFSDFNYENVKNTKMISSIAQGQAISFLLRLYVITRNDSYINSARDLYKSFLYTTNEGGVVSYDEYGRKYLEEAVTDKVSCILDGFVYAIFGVYDYYLITQNKEVKNLFDECCKTVKERLPEFDLGFWSRADCYLDKPKMPASAFYHNVHVQQLKALYKITGEQIYQYYAKKWQKYQENIFYKKIAFVYKCWFKVFYY